MEKEQELWNEYETIKPYLNLNPRMTPMETFSVQIAENQSFQENFAQAVSVA